MPIEARREQVLDSALRIICERGYAAANMEAIARETGVAKTVVYEAYGTRERVPRALLGGGGGGGDRRAAPAVAAGARGGAAAGGARGAAGGRAGRVGGARAARGAVEPRRVAVAARPGRGDAGAVPRVSGFRPRGRARAPARAARSLAPAGSRADRARRARGGRAGGGRRPQRRDRAGALRRVRAAHPRVTSHPNARGEAGVADAVVAAFG